MSGGRVWLCRLLWGCLLGSRCGYILDGGNGRNGLWSRFSWLVVDGSESEKMLAIEHFFILPEDHFFETHGLRLRMLLDIFLKFLSNVANQQMLGKFRVEQILLGVRFDKLIISKHSILVMSKQQLAQLLQLFNRHERSAERHWIFNGVLLEILNGFGLLQDALMLVTFMQGVDAEPRRDGGWVGVEVEQQDGTAEGKDLDNYHRFHALHLFTEALHQLLVFGRHLFIFLSEQGEAIVQILFHGLEAFAVDVLGLLAIHHESLHASSAMSLLNFVQIFLTNVGVAFLEGQTAARNGRGAQKGQQCLIGEFDHNIMR